MTARLRSKVAILAEPGNVRLADLDVPEGREDDGLLRVEATGVCGSDVAAFYGALDWDLPCVLGHEVVGRVHRIGERAAERWGVQEGQRVVLEEYLPCGTCPACTAGHLATCAWGNRYGATSLDLWPGLWGGYADYLYLHPQSLVHPVPEDCSAELAQLFIPIANGLHWVEEVGSCRPGDDVVVIGPGPHGLGCVVAAREIGARSVTVVGLPRDSARLAVATKLGAAALVLSEPEEVVAALHDATGGRMAQTILNTANSPAALDLAVALAGERATIVQIGVTTAPSTAFPVRDVWRKALTIRGVRGRPSRVIQAALALIASGRHPLELLCTHEFGVERAQEALELVQHGGDGVVRALIRAG